MVPISREKGWGAGLDYLANTDDGPNSVSCPCTRLRLDTTQDAYTGHHAVQDRPPTCISMLLIDTPKSTCLKRQFSAVEARRGVDENAR